MAKEMFCPLTRDKCRANCLFFDRESPDLDYYDGTVVAWKPERCHFFKAITGIPNSLDGIAGGIMADLDLIVGGLSKIATEMPGS